MKCKFVLDVEADLRGVSADQLHLLREKTVIERDTGKVVACPYFPEDTVYENPLAYRFVNTGMAVPADEECEKACIPMTPEQRERRQLEYQANCLGIHEDEHRELFFKGVIAGYERVPSGQLAFKRGPNWDQWYEEQQAKKAAKEEDDI